MLRHTITGNSKHVALMNNTSSFAKSKIEDCLTFLVLYTVLLRCYKYSSDKVYLRIHLRTMTTTIPLPYGSLTPYQMVCKTISLIPTSTTTDCLAKYCTLHFITKKMLIKTPSVCWYLFAYPDKTPSPQEGLRVLRRCYKEHIINGVVCRGATWGPKYNPKIRLSSKTKVIIRRLNHRGIASSSVA